MTNHSKNGRILKQTKIRFPCQVEPGFFHLARSFQNYSTKTREVAGLDPKLSNQQICSETRSTAR